MCQLTASAGGWGGDVQQRRGQVWGHFCLGCLEEATSEQRLREMRAPRNPAAHNLARWEGQSSACLRDRRRPCGWKSESRHKAKREDHKECREKSQKTEMSRESRLAAYLHLPGLKGNLGLYPIVTQITRTLTRKLCPWHAIDLKVHLHRDWVGWPQRVGGRGGFG